MLGTIILRRTGQTPLRIRGEFVAGNESSFNKASGSYSGSTGHAQEVKVYRTASGKYVVAIHHTTQWQGEHDTDEATFFPALWQCVEYLSGRVPGWMHTELIDEIGEEEVAEDVS